MSKHCDVAYIIDPKDRVSFEYQDNPKLGLGQDQTSLTFALVQQPLHLGQIVQPGTYRLEVVVAADSFEAESKEIRLNFDGVWNSISETMFRDHIGISVGDVSV